MAATADDHALGGTLGGKLALAVLAVAALVLGAAAGLGAETAGALAAAGLVSASVGGLTADDPGRVALGSVGFLAGAVAVVAALGLAAGSGGGLLVAALLGATLVVSLDAVAGLPEAGETVARTARHTGVVLLVAAALSGGTHVLLASGALAAALAGLGATATAGHLRALAAIQVLALAAGLLLPRVAAVLDSWLPATDGSPDERVGALARAGLSRATVPRAYWVALAAQVALSFVPGVRAAVAAYVGMLPVLGTVLDALLLSGVVQAAFGAVVALCLLVLAAYVAQQGVLSWTGSAPGDTVALAAGGLVAAVFALIGWQAAFALGLLDGVLDPATPTARAVASVGFGPALLLAAFGVVTAVAAALVALREAARAVPLPGGSAGFAVGGTLLFAATVLAAAADAVAVAVFVGVAATVAVWDLGSQGASLLRQVGPDASHGRAAVVHAIGTLAVGAFGVVLASVVAYAVVPLRVPGPDSRATLALALTVVALVAFGYAFRD